MAGTVSYSTRLEKIIVFGLMALWMGYLLSRPSLGAFMRTGDDVAVLTSLAGAGLARRYREQVEIRRPRDNRERSRLRWSYIVSGGGTLFGAAAVAAAITNLYGSSSRASWLIAAALVTMTGLIRLAADWLYEPFVVRSGSRP